MSEGIQVCGGWWRQRCGNVVRIVGESNAPDYPWQCVTGRTYRRDGRFRSYSETEEDLVEFLGVNDPTRRPSLDDRREMVRRFAVALLTRHGDSLAPHDAWDLAAEMADAEPKGG
jgi:hypothetical protein